MAETVYILCALTSLFCAILLWRSYRRNRTALLMWSTLCFVGLAINNLLLVLDLLVFVTEVDLGLVRTGTAVASMGLMTFGLLWEDS